VCCATRLEELKDRFFATVFLGSEFLFLAMLRPGQKVGKKAPPADQ
jgi:hypothetical protein